MPEHDGWKEADITINGEDLSFGVAMTLRVAVSMFLGLIDSEGLSREARDAPGVSLDEAYKRNIRSILQKMMSKND